MACFLEAMFPLLYSTTFLPHSRDSSSDDAPGCVNIDAYGGRSSFFLQDRYLVGDFGYWYIVGEGVLLYFVSRMAVCPQFLSRRLRRMVELPGHAVIYQGDKRSLCRFHMNMTSHRNMSSTCRVMHSYLVSHHRMRHFQKSTFRLLLNVR